MLANSIFDKFFISFFFIRIIDVILMHILIISTNTFSIIILYEEPFYLIIKINVNLIFGIINTY